MCGRPHFLIQKYSFSCKHSATKVQSRAPTSIVRHTFHDGLVTLPSIFIFKVQSIKAIVGTFKAHCEISWSFVDTSNNDKRTGKRGMTWSRTTQPVYPPWPPRWHGDQELETVAGYRMFSVWSVERGQVVMSPITRPTCQHRATSQSSGTIQHQ